MKRGVARASAACAAALLALAAERAAGCGPSFPASYLERGSDTTSPYIDFAFALLDIAAALPADPEPAAPYASSPLSALDAGTADLAVALATPEAAARWSRERRAQWLRAYRAAAARVHAGDAVSGKLDVALPAELAEFELYLRGAAELLAHEEEDRQPAAWRELLALPEAQRRNRTTWVRYMQGLRCAKFGRPAEAAAAYAEVRRRVREGAPDRLGLACASIRRGFRDARTLRAQMDAAPLALRRALACPDPALFLQIGTDMVYAIAQAELGDAALGELLADPVAAEVLVAYLTGHDADLAQRVLARLPPQPIHAAERAAFVAHAAGEDGLAKQWLAFAPPDGLIALWLQAGFQREAGDYVAAAATYRAWLRAFERRRAEFAADRTALALPPPHEWAQRPAAGVQSAPLFFDEEYTMVRRMDEEVYAQLGTTLVYKNDLLEALDCFIRGHSWVDAAYLAEHLIAPADLERYVVAHDAPAVRAYGDRLFDEEKTDGFHWPADPLAQVRSPEGSVSAGEDPTTAQLAFLRYLLARRLLREGQPARAVPYLPAALQARAVQYARLIAQADDAKRPAEARALACYNAARILRWHGLELSGTELQPDARFVDGQYDFGVTPAEPGEKPNPDPDYTEAPRKETVLQSTIGGGIKPAEIRVALATFKQDPPDERFHYRLRAAGLLWRCAELTRDPRLKALAYYEAGYWLRVRQPDLAHLCARMCLEVGAKRAPLAEWMRRHGWYAAPSLHTAWMRAQLDGADPLLGSADEIPVQLFTEPHG